MRLRLDLAYDGTDFHGWARQPGLRTVEGELTEALRTVTRDDVSVVVAGRTDAGVHARGQVVHVDVARTALCGLLRPDARPDPGDRHEQEAVAVRTLLARLRGVLPDDLVVPAAAVAAPGFDARFSAVWRCYRYHLADGGTVDPLRRHSVVSWRTALDADAMAAATAGLLGEHDFLAYCRPRPGASTVRELQRLTVSRESGVLVVEVRADAFCHHMVRALVGALVAVGEGRRSPRWPAEVLARRVREPSVTVMPAHGLVLEEVGYPAAAGLAARAAQARQRRDVTGD